MPMNTNESQSEMDRMQQEAIRRVQEMHARARRAAEVAKHDAQTSGREEPKQPAAQADPSPNRAQGEINLPGPAGDILKNLMQDSERTLILLLILLLVGEEADMGLVLALMYLIIE